MRASVNPFDPAPVAEAAAELSDDAVHVWRLPYERGHGRDALRALLAVYLGENTDHVEFVDAAHGRPALAPPHRLDFNWSHSGEHALVAVAHDLPELGVDIERYRERSRALELATRFFDHSETAWLASLPVAQRSHGFLQLWTAKEAVLKATGRGLAYGLHRVVFAPSGHGLQPHRFDGAAGSGDDWQVHALDLPDDLLGTLAWHGAARKVRLFAPRPDEPSG